MEVIGAGNPVGRVTRGVIRVWRVLNSWLHARDGVLEVALYTGLNTISNLKSQVDSKAAIGGVARSNSSKRRQSRRSTLTSSWPAAKFEGSGGWCARVRARMVRWFARSRRPSSSLKKAGGEGTVVARMPENFTGHE
ncbi:hypothetical protein U1Q18_044336 [Sarracenia purpurea var. burkii]